MNENEQCGCQETHEDCHEHEAHGEGECECCSGDCGDGVIYITEDEHMFLKALAQRSYLPLTRFVMTSSKSEDLESVALAPVYMTDPGDTMETVKKTGRTLTDMEDKGLITLDYDLPIQDETYSVYRDSGLYKDFCELVNEGKKNEAFLFDQPVLETGSIALTALGHAALESLDAIDGETAHDH
jgi:hypothetical protein